MEHNTIASLVLFESALTEDAENDRRRAAVSDRSVREGRRRRAEIRRGVRAAVADGLRRVSDGLRRAADDIQPARPDCPPVATTSA